MVNVQSLIVPVLLFVVLSPGVFLQVPPQGDEPWYGVMIGDTSLTPVLVHALVFAAILYGVKVFLPQVC